MRILKIGTDFSGIGAPEQALKELGIPHEVLFACDKDPFARQTYEANHSAQIFFDDITTRDQLTTPAVDIYFFGFPCQAFSLAGNRKGFDDVRGTLFFNSAEYIRENRPEVFVAENVKGLLGHDKPKGSKSDIGRTFSTILNLLAKTINGQIQMGFYEDNLGYNVFYTVLNSKYFDVPQNRERVFIIGFRDDVNFSFPFSDKVTKRLADICEDEVDEKYYLSEKFMAYLNKHKDFHAEKGNGFGFKPKTKDQIANCIRANEPDCPSDTFIEEPPRPEEIANTIRANGALNSTDNIIEERIIEPAPLSIRRTDYGKEIRKDFESGNIKEKRSEIWTLEERTDGILNTISTHAKDNYIAQPKIIEISETFKDGVRTSQDSRIYDPAGIAPAMDCKHAGKIIQYKTRYRRLTPLECMRAQGFPDSFVKPCSNSQTYKQAGNSITITVLKAILKNALAAIKYKL